MIWGFPTSEEITNTFPFCVVVGLGYWTFDWTSFCSFRDKAKIELTTGGDYGYTFRIMPKNEMLLDSENLNLVKWVTE